MRCRIAILVTAAALAMAVAPSAAQGYGPPHHAGFHGGDNPILHMTKELGLSDAQTAQVKAIFEKYRDGALGEAMRSMHESRANLERTVHDVTATDAQVREAAAAVALLESQMAVQHHQMAIEISAVLTPDQRAKLAESLASMKERRAGPPADGPGND